MSFIETYDLTKVYGKGDSAVVALDHINIDIPKGCFAAITGASGSGKSTLLHMLGAIDHPTSGTVIMDGVDIFKQKEHDLAIMRRKMLGFIFQAYNLIPVLTVKENITLPLKLENRRVDERYLEELLDMLGLSEWRDRLPNQLSGGQQQRVAIARALITRPAIILADEPTGNLDSRNSAEVMTMLRRAVETYDQTLVLITHDNNIARQAHGMLVMRDGRIQEGLSMLQLSLRYLIKQRRRTIITIVSMVLAVAMVSSVGLIVSSLQNMLIVSQTNANGSWHYKLTLPDNQQGNTANMMSLASVDGVEKAGFINEQYYLHMPDGSTNYYGLKQVDAAAMELMPYGVRLTAGRMPQNDSELIISNGSAAFWNSTEPLGQVVTFPISHTADMTFVQTVKDENMTITAANVGQRTFTIVGTFERFRASNAPNISKAMTILPQGTTGESLYLRLTDGGNFTSRIARLVKQSGLEGTPLEAHTRLLRWLVQGEDVIRYAFIGIFVVLTAAVLLVMLVVIKNSYTLSVVEKSDLYGVLRCLNATGKQVRAFVMWEGLITWGIALPIGCLAAWIAMRTIITMAANLGVTMLEGLSMQSPSWLYLCAAAASFATMLLAMQGACKRACSITPVEAFRGNDPFQKDKSKPLSRKSIRRSSRMKVERLLLLRDQQKNIGRFRITVTAIAISVAMFTSFAGAAITLTDFMGSYIDRSGMDFNFSSSHHVEKSPQLFADLRSELSQYPEITGMQEVYPIEYLLDVPENRVKDDYQEVWERFYPVDMPFMNVPAYSSLGTNLKTIEIIPVNRTNYAEMQFAGSAPTYDDLLTNGTVILCQSEVFRKNGMMNVTEFGTFRAVDTVRMAQRVNDEMLQIRELTVAAVLTDTPWFAPERTHGFILVPMETIDGYFEQATSVTNLYTTGMMSIRGNEEQLAALHTKLYERSIALNGFVFNSPYMNNQDVEK